MSYQLLVLKSGREKSVNNRHPWIFSGAVKVFPKAKNGEIVKVVDNHEGILGYGFYDPNSQIVCRIFEFEKAEADFGAEDYWMMKFRNAMALRQEVVVNEHTNAYRLIFAEGDQVPGVIVDIYDQNAVMQLLVKGTEQLKDQFVKCLQNLGIKHVYLKIKTSSQLEDITSESRWLTAPGNAKIEIKEHDKRFIVDVEEGQKTGFFIDQRENRHLLENLSKGKKVLNTFCYTGGFSVYALAGGASEVFSVDISKSAIAMCNENVSLNFGNDPRHQSIDADCFDFLRKSDEKFDIIVLDPPAFAKNARSVPNAARGYKDLNLLAFKKVNKGGLVMTYSCSQNIDKILFQKIVFGAAVDAKRNVKIIQHLGQPADHPINLFHPESEYLKGLLLWIE